jgi:hypothetical protein
MPAMPQATQVTNLVHMGMLSQTAISALVTLGAALDREKQVVSASPPKSLTAM